MLNTTVGELGVYSFNNNVGDVVLNTTVGCGLCSK